jgi:hypothetical protein
MPMVGLRGALYYIVTDSATGKGVEGYGCETWAQHRADELNSRKEKPPTEWIDFLDKANHAKSKHDREGEQHDSD